MQKMGNTVGRKKAMPGRVSGEQNGWEQQRGVPIRRRGLIAILTTSLVLSVAPVQAQKGKAPAKLRLIHADEMTGTVEGGQRLRKLVDNVRFQHGKTTIRCKVALDYPNEERWVLAGNVHIFDDEKTLKADTVKYLASQRLYRAFGNVELTSDSTTIECAELHYFLDERKAVAHKNVTIVDSKENTRLTSHYAEYHRDSEYTLLEENPVFVQLDSSGHEETRIVGKTMESLAGGERISVDQEVVITHKDIRAVCGHADYDRSQEKIVLTKEPVAYQKQNRLAGKKIELHLRERTVTEVHVIEQAVAEFVADSSADASRPNTISGQKLIAYIEGDFVEKIDVNGTATCVYYVVENGVDKGMNRTQGDSMTLFLLANNIRRIILNSKPGKSTGKFLPPGHALPGDTAAKKAEQKKVAEKKKDTRPSP